MPKAESKNEEIGIIPRLKKVHPETVEESPLERLKRLENGEMPSSSHFLMKAHLKTTAFGLNSNHSLFWWWYITTLHN